MKLAGAISTAVLSLSLGVGIPAYAQQEQHDQQEENKDKPAQEKEKKAQPEKTAHPVEKNAQQQEKNTKPEEKNAQQQSGNKQEKTSQQEKNNNVQQQQHSQEAQSGKQEEHGNGNGGGRIPEDRYKANFGRDHRFRVSEANYRDRRFQYGGYSFGFVDAWPSNWLYTQDVYVVEINGVYYLCNASYPGVNLALSVTL